MYIAKPRAITKKNHTKKYPQKANTKNIQMQKKTAKGKKRNKPKK